MEDERLYPCCIPQPFRESVSINRYAFRPRYFFEAILMSMAIGSISVVIMLALRLMLIKFLSMMGNNGKVSYDTVVIVTALLCFITFILCINGKDDDPFSVYIYHIIQYKKNKRTAYYNPRAKFESVSLMQEAQNGFVLPKEKLTMMYRNYINKQNQKNQKDAESNYSKNSQIDYSNMFFEDDLGVVNSVPEGYKKPHRKKNGGGEQENE